MSVLTICVLFTAFCAPLSADVLPEGSKSVTHELVVEPSPHFARYDVYAAPTRGFAGSTRIEPDVPFTFSSKYGTKLYAYERGTPFPEDTWRNDPLATPAGASASGDLPLEETNAVPVASPIVSVSTRLRIASIENGVVQLEVVGHDVRRDHRALVFGAAGVLLGLAGLVLIARRRRRKIASA